MISVAPPPARLARPRKHRAVELDNVITVKTPMRSPSLSRETVLILSNIGRETVRKPLARSGYFQAEELRLGLIARKGTDTNRGSHIEPVVL